MSQQQFSEAPDPHTVFLMEEVKRVREDVEKLESRISAMECAENFDGSDIRYRRLCDEKRTLVQNLCDLRIHVGSTSNSLKRPRTNSPFKIDPLDKKIGDNSQVDRKDDESDNSQALDPKTELPALQIEEYLSAKMRLAQIMRDFNEKKICFLGTDDSRIYIQQYQTISARVKQGDDISHYLRGRLLVFVTGIDKKKKSITETKLFVPDYELSFGGM